MQQAAGGPANSVDENPLLPAVHSCFSKEELAAIRKEHCVHVLSQYVQKIDNKHFLVRQCAQQGCSILQKHSNSAASEAAVVVSDAECTA